MQNAKNLSRTGTRMSWSPIRTFNLILSGFGFGFGGDFTTVVDVTFGPLDSAFLFTTELCLATAGATTLPELLSLDCFLRCDAVPDVLPSLLSAETSSIIVLSGDALSLSKISSVAERFSFSATDVWIPNSLPCGGKPVIRLLEAGFRFFSAVRTLTSLNKLSMSGRFRFEPGTMSSISQLSPICSDSVIRAGNLWDKDTATDSETAAADSILLDDPRTPAIETRRHQIPPPVRPVAAPCESV